ncbi:unnamed protein product [Rhizophagus irregularis]|nr:unnamed protein product [Rhizophagus irregularis]CAB4379679.1 unnamed protein product [Rhizophagus irregularis]CAB4379906.1 unnamed protein product [Rhizophagus irregularis]CAB4380699.1 unnamed protein product [Rhizophagus irregularis]CAB4388360.1 unnamed protein product [Rhizophagus irregularis]
MGNKKFKEIYRAEKQEKKVVSGNRNEGQKEEKQIKERANKLLLDTSPQRVFQNWMASDTKNTNKGNGKPLTRMITDDEVVEAKRSSKLLMIKGVTGRNFICKKFDDLRDIFVECGEEINGK